MVEQRGLEEEEEGVVHAYGNILQEEGRGCGKGESESERDIGGIIKLVPCIAGEGMLLFPRHSCCECSTGW